MKPKTKLVLFVVILVLIIVGLAAPKQEDTTADITPTAGVTQEATEDSSSPTSLPDDKPVLTLPPDDKPVLTLPPDDKPVLTLPPDDKPVLTLPPAFISERKFSPDMIPEYSGTGAFVPIANNIPFFENKDLSVQSFEIYANLDSLGRCGVTFACIGTDLMPTDERGDIGDVKPSGWHTVKYDVVDGKYLYNRCHLIGWQLTAENANRRNLITGTRYMNVEGMLPFENMVADYVKETHNHVMYRVTPVFQGKNLVATGVLMEAYSVEDAGEGICFCVFCYNVQPGVTIDFATGESVLFAPDPTPTPVQYRHTYIVNTNTHKFHYPSCGSADDIKDSNRARITASREEMIAQGYKPCGRCDP